MMRAPMDMSKNRDLTCALPARIELQKAAREESAEDAARIQPVPAMVRAAPLLLSPGPTMETTTNVPPLIALSASSQLPLSMLSPSLNATLSERSAAVGSQQQLAAAWTAAGFAAESCTALGIMARQQWARPIRTKPIQLPAPQPCSAFPKPPES